MHCPFCTSVDTRVINSSPVSDASQVCCRRECIKYHERFTTFEISSLVIYRVVKRDDLHDLFNEHKIRLGI